MCRYLFLNNYAPGHREIDILNSVVPAKTGTHDTVPLETGLWIPACAGMTGLPLCSQPNGYAITMIGRREPHQLLHLHQLQRLSARPLNHHRARVAQLVSPLKKRHTLALQLGNPRVKISYAKRQMIVALPARAH